MRNIRYLQQGMSMIEVMIIVIIIAILAAVAIPSMQSLFANADLNSFIDNVKSSVKLAKNEALRRGVSVNVCSKDPDSVACGGAADWANGLIVYFSNTLVSSGANATLIQYSEINDALNVTAAFGEISFNSRGVMTSGVSMVVNPDDCSRNAYAIAISALGVVDVDEQACA
jgi:prepilin-type N-terminal cleavage/methylation domain-containing protein